jgi:hypothetical protein
MSWKKIEFYILAVILTVICSFVTVPVHAFVINQLTISGNNATPDVDGSNIVWVRGGSIYRWDGTAEALVTNNSNGSNANPALSGSDLVFQRYDAGASSWDVYHKSSLDPSAPEYNYFTNSYWDGTPDIQGSNIAWSSNFYAGGPNYIFYSSDLGTNSTNISYGVTDAAENPAVYGNGVVWSGRTGSAWDIYYWDGSSTTNLSSGYSTGNGNPAIYGSDVVWRGYDGNDWEIYLWDGSTVTQITNNDYNDDNPAIWGSNIVWEGWSGDSEIYLWDGSMIRQITNNDFNDQMPAISGSTIVWQGANNIYTTTTPEPGSLLLIGTGVVVMLGLRRKQTRSA